MSSESSVLQRMRRLCVSFYCHQFFPPSLPLSPRICTHFLCTERKNNMVHAVVHAGEIPIGAAAAHFCKAIKTDVNTTAKSRKLQPYPKLSCIRGKVMLCVKGCHRRLFMPNVSDCVPWGFAGVILRGPEHAHVIANNGNTSEGLVHLHGEISNTMRLLW